MGDQVDFGARIYDPRVGRWLSADPLEYKFPGLSSYNFVENDPLFYLDKDGKEKYENYITIDQTTGKTSVLRVLVSHEVQYVETTEIGVGHSFEPVYEAYDINLNHIIVIDKAGKSTQTNSTTQGDYRGDYMLPVTGNVSRWFGRNFTSQKDDPIGEGWYLSGESNSMGDPLAAMAKYKTTSIDHADMLLAAIGGYDATLTENVSEILNAKGVDRLLKIVEYLNAEREASKKTGELARKAIDALQKDESEPDSAICPTCGLPQDQQHIDEINGAGFFKDLQLNHKTNKTKKTATNDSIPTSVH